MVAFNSRITLLAASVSLAALSLNAGPVDAVAVAPRYTQPPSPEKAQSRQQPPVIPLPSPSKRKGSGSKSDSEADPGDKKSVGKKSTRKKHKHHFRRDIHWNPLNPISRIVSRGEDQVFFQYEQIRSPKISRHHHDHDKIIIEGDHVHAHVHERDYPENQKRFAQGEDGHDGVHKRHRHHHHPAKIIVSGNDDHVKVHLRAPEHHNLRSPVIVSDEQGTSYTVAQARRRSRREKKKRSEPADGHVDVMSSDEVLGRFMVDYTQTPPVINVSSNNQSDFKLIKLSASAASLSQDPDDALCNLVVPVVNASTMTEDYLCATYDPAPTQPDPLTCQPCNPNLDDPHRSQQFICNSKTGVIRPTVSDQGSDASAANVDSGTDSIHSEDNVDGGDEEGGEEGVTSIDARDDAGKGNSSTVTLVFKSTEPIIDEQGFYSSANSSSSTMTPASTSTTSTSVTTADSSIDAAAMTSLSVDSPTPFTSTSPPTSTTEPASSATDSMQTLAVEVFDASSSTLTPTSTSGSILSPSDSSIASSASAVNVDAVASSIAASVQLSYSSALASSTNPVAAPTQTVSQREVVDTDPYPWVFKAEPRF